MSDIMFCEKLPELKQGHIAVIDGKYCMTSSDFFHCVWEQLQFPDAQNCNWDAYLDWMRDLSWLDSKEISIIILNYDSFLSNEPDNKKYFESDLKDVVFPFWEKNAKNVFKSTDAIKNITFYLIKKTLFGTECPATSDVMSIIRRDALNGQKTPHSTSQPLLRMHNGTLCFAAFIFFYNREQIQTAMVERPGVWVIGDLKTGEITHRYSCAENDFSNQEFGKLYSISSSNLPMVSNQYWCSAYAILDLIRDDYIHNGTFNKMLYKDYLERVYRTTPTDYKVFYEDLNNIETEDTQMDNEMNQSIEEVIEETPETPVEAPEQAPVETPIDAPAEAEESEASNTPAVTNEDVLEKLLALQEAVAELQQSFDYKIAEDTHKNGLFDNMHRELIRYQNGALDKLIDTFALDVIQLIDSAKRSYRVYEKNEPTEENYKKLLRNFKGFIEDLNDILYRQNVEVYNVSGHEVDVRRQKIIQTVPTDDKSKDNLVAVRVADGYEKGDKVLRPERIKIFKYEEPTDAPSEE